MIIGIPSIFPTTERSRKLKAYFYLSSNLSRQSTEHTKTAIKSKWKNRLRDFGLWTGFFYAQRDSPELTAGQDGGIINGNKEVEETKAISKIDREKINNWKVTPDDVLYFKYKNVYDNPKYFDQQTGNVKYPGEYGDVNKNGFTDGECIEETLQPGTIIDRYGSNGTGRFFSPEGTLYGERALPPFMENQPYTKYEILKPMEIKSGEIAPWFEQPGGGKQFLSDFSIDELRDMGIIRIIE